MPCLPSCHVLKHKPPTPHQLTSIVTADTTIFATAWGINHQHHMYQHHFSRHTNDIGTTTWSMTTNVISQSLQFTGKASPHCLIMMIRMHFRICDKMIKEVSMLLYTKQVQVSNANSEFILINPLIQDGLLKKNCCSFGFCPKFCPVQNVLVPPVTKFWSKVSWLPYSTFLYVDFHLLCSMTKLKEHSREIC